MTSPIDPLIRDTEVAKLLGCSRATVWRHVRGGRLPQPIKIGGMSRFPQSEVDAALEQAKSQRGQRS